MEIGPKKPSKQQAPRTEGPAAPSTALDGALSQATSRGEDAPLPVLPPGVGSFPKKQLAVLEDTLNRAAFGETALASIVKRGGYKAVLADPRAQQELADVLDSLISQRIIDVRNQLRDLGWHYELGSTTMHPPLIKGSLKFKSQGTSVVGAPWNNAGWVAAVQRQGEKGYLVHHQDLLEEPAAELAARIDQEAAPHRTEADVEADLAYARHMATNTEGASAHFEKMAGSLEVELGRIQAGMLPVGTRFTLDSEEIDPGMDEIDNLEEDAGELITPAGCVWEVCLHEPFGEDPLMQYGASCRETGGWTNLRHSDLEMKGFKRVEGPGLELLLTQNGFPNAAKAVQAFTEATPSTVHAMAVAMHNVAGILQRRTPTPEYEDLFSRVTNARMETERALLIGGDPKGDVARHEMACRDHTAAAEDAAALGLEEMAHYHEAMATWHREAHGVKTPGRKVRR